MLHKMSEVRGWSHNEMLQMSKSTFYRYYGYWYQDQLEEHYRMEHDKKKQERESKRNQPRQWKSL